MKKLIFFCTIVLFASSAVLAQSYTKDSKMLNLGIGLGGSYTTGKVGIPPISASFEKGITDKISVGGVLGYAASKYELYGFKAEYSYILIGARGSYHFYNTDKIDAYGGAILGYNIVSSKITGFGSAASASGLAYSGFVGGRYLLTEKLSAFAEVGYGISLLTIGVTLKL
jgi:hypothetical protein